MATDCQDGVFCNGAEVCVSNACIAPGNPCQAGETCNEDNDVCVKEGIPTVSAWGLIIMTLLLLAGGKIYFRRRPATGETGSRG